LQVLALIGAPAISRTPLGYAYGLILQTIITAQAQMLSTEKERRGCQEAK